jgi:hypothetical protein
VRSLAPEPLSTETSADRADLFDQSETQTPVVQNTSQCPREKP